MSAATVPYKAARLASLFLSFAFGVVALALCINALVKGDKQKDDIKRLVPRGTTVSVDTNDVDSAGAVVAAFSAALALVSLASLSLLLHTLLTPKRGIPLSTRTLWIQGIGLSLVTLGLFASLLAMTVFVATRRANVTAFIGDVRLRPDVVQSLEKLLGATSVYHEIDYLRLAVILPWIAFLTGAISSALSLFAAARARAQDDAERPDTVSQSTEATGKKGSMSVEAERV